MGEIRQRGRVYWIRYYRDGRRYEESARSTKYEDAKRLLKVKEGDIARGVPMTAHAGRLRFEEAAEDLLNDYRMNGKRSLDDLRRRVEKHLKPFFEGRRMATVTTPEVRRFVGQRQAAGASNGEINRELTALKRMFTLALQAGKLLHRPHIPLLKENNVRAGFFERDQFESIRHHLDPHFRALVTFAYITGWRVPSEILPLEWRHIDFKAGEVRLDPGTTKNEDGRVFPFTAALRTTLEDQQRLAKQVQRAMGKIPRYVFFYMVPMKDGAFGEKTGERITESGFNKAWRRARIAAGCPGRIPHDFRRTAIRTLERAGVSRSVAMKLTGHKTEAVYRRYAIVTEGDLRQAVERLDGDNFRDNLPTAPRADRRNPQNS